MKLKYTTKDGLVRISSFESPRGVTEYYVTINSIPADNCKDKLDKLYDLYTGFTEDLGLSDDTLTAARFYLCDIVNQFEHLQQSAIYQKFKNGACSVIQQCPIYGGSVSILVYHTKGADGPVKKEFFQYDSDEYQNACIVHGEHYNLIWSANFTGESSFDAYKQTTDILHSFNTFLTGHGMSLLGNGIRTWVYVRDLDNHYQRMVEARKKVFEKYGLTPETRYLASTGIEGVSRNPRSLVSIDTYSIDKIKPEQIIRMEAPGFMCPTHTYNVTFERGLRVRFGDRSHLHISGTASIDEHGEVMYKGDAGKQTERMLKNVRALLQRQNADFDDLAYVIIYIRNFKDERKVMDIILKTLPENIPFLLVEGSVCRPEWLVEIEGIGIIPDAADFPPFF